MIAGAALHVLPHDKREVLRPFFTGAKHERPLIDSVLKGAFGHAITDDPEKPAIGLIYYWCFTILAGDPTHPLAADLIRRILPEPSMIPSDSGWMEVVHSVLGPPKEILHLTEFAPGRIDRDQIREMKTRLADGFKIVPVGRTEARQIAGNSEFDFDGAYGSISNFLKYGVGYCAVSDAGVVACSALSLFKGNGYLEISVETHPEFQRRGLATAVSAHLVDYALEHKFTPLWVAMNEPSCMLARRLGFVESDSYDLHEF